MLRSAVSRLRAPAAAPVVASSRAASTLTQILDGSVWCVHAETLGHCSPSRSKKARGGGARRTRALDTGVSLCGGCAGADRAGTPVAAPRANVQRRALPILFAAGA